MISIGIAYWQNEVKLRMETIAEHGSRRRRLHLVLFQFLSSSDNVSVAKRIQQGIVNRLNRALDQASREQSLNRTLAMVVVEPTERSCFPTTGICLGIQLGLNQPQIQADTLKLNQKMISDSIEESENSPYWVCIILFFEMASNLPSCVALF